MHDIIKFDEMDLMTKQELFEKLNRQNIFWSYRVCCAADITDAILIEHTLIYADVDEINSLFKIYEKKQISKIWEERIIPDSRYKKLNRYLARFFFDILNVEDYLSQTSLKYSRYEKFKRLNKTNEIGFD